MGITGNLFGNDRHLLFSGGDNQRSRTLSLKWWKVSRTGNFNSPAMVGGNWWQNTPVVMKLYRERMDCGQNTLELHSLAAATATLGKWCVGGQTAALVLLALCSLTAGKYLLCVFLWHLHLLHIKFIQCVTNPDQEQLIVDQNFHSLCWGSNTSRV